MMIRHTRDNAVYFTSSLLDDIRSYPQSGEESVDNYQKNPTDARGNLRIVHGFSTKHGGVSTMPYISDLNFGFAVGEARAVTVENYRRFAFCLGIPGDHVVCANQTHTARVLRVDARHRGMGISVPYEALLDAALAEEGFDGLVTDAPGVALAVRVADCVPILFCDPVHGIIGACHAGWRGTLAGIAAETVSAMCALGAERGSIRAAIGHAVGTCCYEIDEAFYRAFLTSLGETLCESVFSVCKGEDGSVRRHCDLRRTNALLLAACGIMQQHIDTSTLCTCCHPQLFHSHRYAQRHTGGKRGLMAAFISMEEGAN
ncbi:MAG: peptidoglycan editing factor PgeF [Clostridia bacterium]|nr:peptidoglycan editing factor PgeF [Clostridia bacterium]